MTTSVESNLFDLHCLLERAALVGNLGLEAGHLNEQDQAALVADLLWKIREAQSLVSKCMNARK